MDFASAVAFVEARATALERARLYWVLAGTPPEPATVQPFVVLQNEDGGFPFGMVAGNLSTVDNTLTALWWLDELGMLGSPIAERACAYLRSVQQADGGWDEEPAIGQYELPPWVAIGDLRTRLYLSAYATYWLTVQGCGTEPAGQKALGFLLAHQDETGKFYGYLHSTWIATSVLLMAGPAYAEAARRGLQLLESRPLADWESSQIAWALSCLEQAGLPREHPFVQRGLAELGRRQQPDGSWASEDGAGLAAGATIQVLKVLQRYGLLPS